MMHKPTLLLTLFLCISSILAVPPQEEEGVLVLTKDSFDETVNNEDITLVEFYAPWCGHCKKLAPEFSAAAYELRHKNPPVKLAKVDCTVETDLQSRFGIKGYPTLKIFRKGNPSEYSGPRDKQGIIDYMEKQAGPAAKSLTTAESLKEFLKHPDISVVGYFPSLAGKAFDNFRSVAGALRENFRFAEVSDSSLHKHSEPKIVIHSKDKEQSEVVFDAEHDSESLTQWLWHKSVPLVGELTKASEERYKRKALPLVKLFFDVDHTTNVKQTNYWVNRLKKVAKDVKGAAEKLSFTFANKKDYASDLAKYGREGKDLVLAIEDAAKNLKYVYAQDKLDVEGIKQFVTDYLSNKLEPHIKSEPVPADNSGPVKVVVGKNFNDVVLDETKDVLIELYAPWCGHCKKLEPVYNELGQKLSNIENVVIAKMDATANDTPHPKYQAKGYPTLFFAPANDKENPVPYQGERDLKSMEEFIKRKATSWKKVASKSEL